MNKYEAMFILKPDLPEQDRKTLFNQISDAMVKNNGQVFASSVWAEKRKFNFRIKKHDEGMYYLVNFSVPPPGIKEIERIYKLNENILRVLITQSD
jgi:small subunit ribosomal protein S6